MRTVLSLVIIALALISVENKGFAEFDLSEFNGAAAEMGAARVKLFETVYHGERRALEEQIVAGFFRPDDSIILSRKLFKIVAARSEELGCQGPIDLPDACHEKAWVYAQNKIQTDIEALSTTGELATYLNYNQKGQGIPPFFIYSSPHLNTAKTYGNLVVGFDQRQQQIGVDLFSYNAKLNGYYTSASRLDFKKRFEHFMDSDEYVLAGSVPNRFLDSLTVYNEGLKLDLRVSSLHLFDETKLRSYKREGKGLRLTFANRAKEELESILIQREPASCREIDQVMELIPVRHVNAMQLLSKHLAHVGITTRWCE